MGITSAFKRNRPAPVTDPATLPIVSPWSSNDLQRIVFDDIFGAEAPLNTRSAAMRIPAVARARNLVVSTICKLPLQLVTGQTPEGEQPAWFTQTGDGSSFQLRNAWTVDDLIFYGWSAWSRTYDGDQLVAASRINFDEWDINDDMRVEVNGNVVSERDVIVFCGLHEGVLSYGSEALADTRKLYGIVRARLANPVPQIDLHQTSGDPLTEKQIDALIDRWSAARNGSNGGVAYTNAAVEARELGAGDAALAIDARNAAAVDMARLIGVSAGRIDASGVNATLTYETKEGRNQELVDFDLALYMTPISARLSMDDVTEPGQRVDFDLADFIDAAPSIAGPNFKD